MRNDERIFQKFLDMEHRILFIEKELIRIELEIEKIQSKQRYITTYETKKRWLIKRNSEQYRIPPSI